MNLSEIRERINGLDDQLSTLLTERMRLALDVARYKKENNLPVLDRSREREILGEITERGGEEFEEYLKVLFSVLFDMSKSYQIRHLTGEGELAKKLEEARKNTPELFPKKAVVACQGIEGAYSQQAAERLFSIPKIVYFKSFEGVFQAVREGLCRYGILPIENSVHGSVLPVYDLMRDCRFHIVRSLKMSISHSLLAKEGTVLSDVKEILSHEQAIGQCSRFIEKSGATATAVENTAVAAKAVADSPRKDLAAIASKNCAELYGLRVLADSIENNGNNFTRFICISRDLEVYPGANRISLVLNLPHRPGMLYSTIARFAALGLNLTKLESRPIPGKDFEFMFYFDLDASVWSDELVRLLSHFEKTLDQFTFLGCYGEV